MKKLIPLVLALVVLLSSCLESEVDKAPDIPNEALPAPETKEELYSLYSAVGYGQPKEELDSLYGEPTPSYDDFGLVKFYTYFNQTKSAGVSVIFDNEQKLKIKTLFFNTKQNLIPFSGRYDDDKIRLIKTDMALDSAIDTMSSTPLELSCEYSKDGPDSTKNIYCWYNENGDNFMIHTENGFVENVALYRD